jgi:hypothetical protein
MTTEALRKVIMVTTWTLTKDGLTISYVREDHNPKSLHLILNRADTLRELYAVGDIEEISQHDCSIGKFNGGWHTYNEIAQLYKMCQWEALAIAIRHEEEKELANDMNMLELDAAINALK